MSNIISTFPSGSEDKLKKSGDTMTGALTLSGAPTENLHAATKQYVDTTVRSTQYTATLSATDWIQDGSTYTYTLSIPTLTCGSDGTVSPTITYTSNQEEYNNITSATADSTAHTITFTASKAPTSDIGIIIQDTH